MRVYFSFINYNTPGDFAISLRKNNILVCSINQYRWKMDCLIIYNKNNIVFIRYNSSTIFKFSCEYVYYTFSVIKISYNNQLKSHVIQEYWNAQSICIWCFPSHFSAFNENNWRFFFFLTGYLLFNMEYRSSLPL